MKKSRYVLLLFSLCVLLGGIVYWLQGAERKRFKGFSKDAVQFPSELFSLFADAEQSKSQRAASEKTFTEIWLSTKVSEAERAEVLELSNSMFRAAGQNTLYFKQWHTILDYYLRDSIKSIEYPLLLDMLRYVLSDRRIRAAEQVRYIEEFWLFVREGTLRKTPNFEWHVTPAQLQVRFQPELHYAFKDVSLVCRRDTDSIVLENTTGEYYPMRSLWEGRGAKVYWLRSNFSKENVNATLANYKVSTNEYSYTADSVVFWNADYLNAPIKGTFKDALVRSTDKQELQYPQFVSYEKRLHLKNMLDGVRFVGGCEMIGARLIGVGTPDEPVLFSLKRKGKPFLSVQAERMAFSREFIGSTYAQVTIHLGQDSLYHRGLRFAYSDESKQLRLSPTDLLVTQSPLYSSFHRMSMHFEELTWNVGADKMIFGPFRGSTSARASFESDNYFDIEEFDQRMDRDNEHPILSVANFTEKIGSRTFQVADYARYLGYSYDQVSHVLMYLAVEGFIQYDMSRARITVMQKLYDQISARGARRDYDVIRFSSAVGRDKANAVLDLNTSELDVYSVSHISVSDSQNVNIEPRGRFIKLGRNRTISFDGKVDVGMFTFMGKGMSFNYETFSIDLKEVDSASMRFQNNKKLTLEGKRARDRVVSYLQQMTGRVHIDKPDNKSGLSHNPEYPIFESTKPSFVYYDDKKIYNGVYERKNFYFEIPPFVFKNLNNFEPEDLVFGGTMYTDDIFAPFQDTLRLREDASLGFIHQTPVEGMTIYAGKGRFFNNIDLSNAGLKGDGKLKYLTSVTTSPEFKFFPDSTLAQSTAFDITRLDGAIGYPDTHGLVHPIRWLPRKDIFFAYKGETPFNMYEHQSDFIGDYTLQPVGLTGNGVVDMRKAHMTSQFFQFDSYKWLADTMAVKFYVPGQAIEAFTAGFLSGRMNYQTREGDFWRINASIYGKLTAIRYDTHADRVIWPMDLDLLRFQTKTQQDAVAKGTFRPVNMLDQDTIPVGSIFYSVAQYEDSLYFMSRYATYNLRMPRLDADSVPYVLVADAVSYPHDGKLAIENEKRMLPLKEARLVANVFDRYHHIYDASLNLAGRFKYSGKGFIDYIDERDSATQLKLDSIYITPPHEGNATQAYGFATVDQNFKLSPRFHYEGKITVDANEPYYLYQGGVQPLYNCPDMRSTLLNFMSRLRPDSLMIPINFPQRDMNNKWLASGVVISNDSTHLYHSFVSPRFRVLDRDLVRPEGFMTFDRKRGRFVMADSIQFVSPDSVAQRLELDPQECRSFTDGILRMPFELNRVKTHVTGRMLYDPTDSIHKFRAFMDFDFLFSREAMQLLMQALLTNPDLDEIDQTQENYTMGLRERLPKRVYERAKNQIELFGAVRELLPQLNATISLADVQMRWDQTNYSYVSVGQIGIGSLMGERIGKKVNGFVELLKRNGGDKLVIYIEPAPGVNYTFTYQGFTMYITSSNQDFMKIIKDTSKRKRKLKSKGDEKAYVYQRGTTRETAQAQLRYRELSAVRY